MAMREGRERGRKLPQVKPKKIRWSKDKVKRERKKKMKKEKDKKGKAKRKKKKKEGRMRDTREKKKREQHFPSRSLANWRSKRVGLRDKVGPRVESYVWVPVTSRNIP